MDYLIYFVITIAILVFVHEFGHFAAAKLSGMRADIFAIGFGKRLFGYNKITGFTFGDLDKDWDGNGNTDYRLCLIPLGGYVKIAGMVDESFDTEFAKQEPKPYEFRSKSTPKKLFVITAGVLMNLILTIAILWGINFFTGKEIINSTTVVGVAEGSFAAEAGFQDYDKITSINGKAVNSWDDVIHGFMIESAGSEIDVDVLRNGTTVSFQVAPSLVKEAAQQGYFLRVEHSKPFISDVVKNSPAEDAGVEPGDIFLSINNVDLISSQQVIDIVSSNPEKTISLTILRNEDTIKTAVTPVAEGKIGIALAGETYVGPTVNENYGFIGSITQALTNTWQYTALTFAMVKNVFKGSVEFGQVFGGPVKIAQFAARSAESGIVSFLRFLALLSLSLAIINILPFPVLDGGHFVIISIEGIMRRELPIKVKMAIQNAGFFILLLLMAYIIYSDIINL